MELYPQNFRYDVLHSFYSDRRENLDATSAMVGRICPPGGDRVKVSENLGATWVAPVAPADTSLGWSF